MKTSLMFAACASVLALGACNQSGEAPAAKGGAASTPAAMDGPLPGLWRITTSTDAMPAGPAPTTTETCVAHATFETPNVTNSAPGVDCTSAGFHREGDAMVGSTTCTMQGGMKTEVNTRVTGDFNTRYTMVATSKVTGTPVAMPDTVVTVNAERLGDCPAA